MEDRESRLTAVARIAVALEAQTGCPAQLLIAQWAVESEWGAKPVGRANFFGIKAHPQAAHTCTVWTHEVITLCP
jgi:flagellum-specific peptidoglycan hydrolase FlgJ